MKILISASILILINAVGGIAQKSQTPPCPTIFVNSQFVPKPDEPITVSVTLSEEAGKFDIKYFWTVKGGQILEGQGTSVIKATWQNFTNSFLSTVKIEGLPENCENTASEIMNITPPPEAEKIDEFFGDASKLESGRIVKIIKAITENPSAQLFIIVPHKKKIHLQKQTEKERGIRKMLIKDNKKIADRITFINILSLEQKVQLWLVPAGAVPPEIIQNN